jgi:hypothetical protein
MIYFFPILRYELISHLVIIKNILFAQILFLYLLIHILIV